MLKLYLTVVLLIKLCTNTYTFNRCLRRKYRNMLVNLLLWYLLVSISV